MQIPTPMLLVVILNLSLVCCATHSGVRNPTPVIIDPAVTELVEDLAQATRIESERVGIGGEKSAVYAKFLKLSQFVRKAQAIDLLHHPSPVVRGYLARYIVTAFPEEMNPVYELLHDSTAVTLLNGCNLESASIALVTLWALEDNRTQLPVRQALLRAGRDLRISDIRLRYQLDRVLKRLVLDNLH